VSKLLISRGDILPDFKRSGIDEVLQSRVPDLHVSHFQILYSGFPCIIARGSEEQLIKAASTLAAVGLHCSISDEGAVTRSEDLTRFNLVESLAGAESTASPKMSSAVSSSDTDSVSVDDDELLDINLGSDNELGLEFASVTDVSAEPLASEPVVSTKDDDVLLSLDEFDLGVPDLGDDDENDSFVPDTTVSQEPKPAISLELELPSEDDEPLDTVSEAIDTTPDDTPGSLDFGSLSLAPPDPGSLEPKEEVKPVEIGDLGHLTLAPQEDENDKKD
jgi:hypothetical protein